MTSGNRVEELESKVTELQATVNGLTDELMECKERVRALESEVEPDMDIIEGGPGASADNAVDGVGEDSTPDQDPASTSADTDNTDAPEGTSERESDSESDSEPGDIIVA